MPLTEINRIAAVNSYKYLELNDNKELNDLVLQVSEICNTSMASLTLLDEHVQWIRCGSGIIESQENVDDSFCKYLLNTHKILEVPNALLDPRFVHNTSVNGSRHIRFYAGFPLITASGLHLGALSVYDEEPHKLNREQRSMLKFIAKQVMHILEMLLGLNTYKLQQAKNSVMIPKTTSIDRQLNAIFSKAAAVVMGTLYPHKLQLGSI